MRKVNSLLLIIVLLGAITPMKAHAQNAALGPACPSDSAGYLLNPNINPSQTADPQLATCNGPSGSSVLGPAKTPLSTDRSQWTSVGIFAPEVNPASPTGSSYNGCVIVYNKSNNTYFVPWKQPKEWSAFLATMNTAPYSNIVVTTNCCYPVLINKLTCPANAGGGTLNLPTSISLGHKSIAAPLDPTTLAPDPAVLNFNYADPGLLWSGYVGPNGADPFGLGSWAAPYDTPSIPLPTTDANGNAINISIEFSCMPYLNYNKLANQIISTPDDVGTGKSGWVIQHMSGSCVPTNGACATFQGGYLSSLPNDHSQLCAPGSVIDESSIVTTATGWNYTCDGTGGNGCAGGACTNASCTILNKPMVYGSCGDDDLSNFTTALTATDANLCATGVVGTFSTDFTLNGAPSQNGANWWWTCLNSDGSLTNSAKQTCEAFSGAPLNAQCAVIAPNTIDNATTIASLVAACQGQPTCPAFCASGALDPASPPTVNSRTGEYTWTCDGSNNGSNARCTGIMSTNVFNGTCGGAAGGAFTSSTTPSNLCPTINGVTETVVTPPGVVFSATSNTWTWSCNGIIYDPTTGKWISGGSPSGTCVAYYNATPGVCGTAATTPATYTSTSGPSQNPAVTLCSSGTASSPFYNNNGSSSSWNWTCTGPAPDPGTRCSVAATGTTTVNNPVPGSCGSTTIAPCQYGTIVGTAACNTLNPPSCTWSCQGDTGTSPVPCSGTGTASSASNVTCTDSAADPCCGIANGLPAYLIPNLNLCAPDSALLNPPGVTGSGPWAWTCEGATGNYACGAPICTQCQGTTTRANSATFAVTGTIGTCNITSAIASWNETDDLTSAPGTGTITGTGTLGAFTISVGPGPVPIITPSYCSPCQSELNFNLATDSITGLTLTYTGKDSVTGLACTSNELPKGVSTTYTGSAL